MAALFAARLAGWDGWDRVFGAIALLVILPMIYLLARARRDRRPRLYFVWIGVVIAFQLVEFTLDYALALDFRRTDAIVIPYVVLFFASMGALVGLASQAGRVWVAIAGPLFLLVGALAFISRISTGL